MVLVTYPNLISILTEINKFNITVFNKNNLHNLMNVYTDIRLPNISQIFSYKPKTSIEHKYLKYKQKYIKYKYNLK